MRIVQLANAYSPTSGGLRTVVDALGRGYVAAGHDRVLVIPGKRHTREEGSQGSSSRSPASRSAADTG
ncbi:hypothetical protein ACFQ9X_15330 [Catenulispora yoronensis]